jgi:drug/metabolite transporter (DMT)-like permease
MQQRHWIGFAFLAIVWGTTWLAVRVVVTEAPPFLSAGVRFVLAALLLGAVVKWRGLPLGWSRYAPAERRLMLQLSVWMIVIPYAFVFWAEQFITAGLAGVLFSTHSVFVVLFESLRQRRNVLTGKVLAGVLLAFGGVVVIFWPRLGIPEEWLGALAMLGAAASSSLATITAKYKAKRLDPMVMVTWQMGIGAVPLLLLGLWFESGSTTTGSLKAWLSLGYLIVFGSCVAFVLYYWLLKKLTTVQISTMAYVTPIVAVTSGWLLLGETMGWFTLAGAAMALTGVYLLHSKEPEPASAGD